MFSREEAHKLKEEFWTRFGKRMKKHVSAETESNINWINYKTSVKNINFRMEANNKFSSLTIEITHKDTTMRDIFYEQFTEMRNYFHDTLREEWVWNEHDFDKFGNPIASISTRLDGYNVMIKDNWNRLYQFFEPRMVRLDTFWCDAKETFKDLES